MPVLANVEIAGVTLSIGSRHPIILRPPPPSYRSFVGPAGPNTPAPDIHVSLEVGGPPSIEGMTPVFDTGQTWLMVSDGEHYFLRMYPPPGKEPLWLARISRDFTSAHVFCGGDLVSEEDGEIHVETPIRYPLDQLILMHFLAERHGALIHAAGVGINGRGFIFPGKSGAGKSTLTRQLTQQTGLSLLSDDRVIVRKTGDAYTVFGTPWPGEAGVAANESLPLDGIVFIRHGAENAIQEIPSQVALENLLPVTSVPWYDRDAMSAILSFCGEMVSSVPTHELHFKPTAEVVHVLSDLVSPCPPET